MTPGRLVDTTNPTVPARFGQCRVVDGGVDTGYTTGHWFGDIKVYFTPENTYTVISVRC